MPTDDDYLSARLRETRDVASFGSGAAVGGTGAPDQVIERVTELPGAEHLGGRKVKDRFIRSGGASAGAPVPVRLAKPAGDDYLDARLKEIHDAAPKLRSVKPDMAAEAVDTYRALRRQLGGE